MAGIPRVISQEVELIPKAPAHVGWTVVVQNPPFIVKDSCWWLDQGVEVGVLHQLLADKIPQQKYEKHQ